MITLLTGENSFEIESEIKLIVSKSNLVPEIVDGINLRLDSLSDLIGGTTLFSESRLIIIKSLSENAAIWNDFYEWIDRVSDDVYLILVEPKPDKRTRTYKELQKYATVKEFSIWTDIDRQKAIQWVADTADRSGIELNKKCAQLLIDKIGLDQWQLWHAIEKLSLLEKVDEEAIDSVIDSNPSENVFNLFEAALRGDRLTVSRMVRIFEQTEDPFRMFGLLSGQVYQLSILAVGDASTSEIAKDIGVHQYSLTKLSSHSKRLGRAKVRKIVALFARADDDMKTSVADPWFLIERALVGIDAS